MWQTSRVWNNKFDSFLIEYDLHPSAVDLCIYYNAKDHNLIIIVVAACNIHSCRIENIIQYMGEVFLITTSGPDTHAGLHIIWKIKSTKWYFWTRTITSKRFYMIIDFRLQTQWQFMHSLIVIFYFIFWQMMICHKKHFHVNNWLKGLLLLFLPFDLTCFMLSTTMSSCQRNQQKPIAWHWNNQIFAYNFKPSYLLGPTS